MKMKRVVSAVTALMMLGSTAQATAFTVFAEDGASVPESSYEEKLDKFGRLFARIMLDTDYSYTVDDPEISVSAPEQRKFDLRDVDGKNYVTPVKDQRNTGNCWAYSAIACIETNMLYELGIDLNECDESEILDFSERQIAWFVGVVLGNNSLYPSQTGEGSIRYASYLEMLKDDPDYQIIFDDFFSGGYDEYILSMLSTGQGPCEESLVPNLDEVYMSGTVTIYDVLNDPAVCEDTDEDPLFDYDNIEDIDFSSKEEFLEIISDESLLGHITFDEDGNTDWYVGNGRYWNHYVDKDAAELLDWSVDDAYRFTGYSVENILMTRKLASEDPDTGSYYMNENVLNSIKNELVNGRAVSIGLNYGSSDQSKDLRHVNYIDKNGERTLYANQADCLCYYCFNDNYDPDDSESVNKTLPANHAVTIVGYDDDFPKEYFNDPKGTLKGDGAFIVKNSWGSADSYNPYGNNGDGFFYVSYYDQSLTSAMIIDYKLPKPDSEESPKLTVNFEHLYDVMPAPCYEACVYDDASYANAYYCEHDQKITSLGTLFSHPNNTVKYDVYILNDDYSGPTDGTLAASMTVKEQYAGYHNTDLEEPLYLKKGTSFSVVVTVVREDGKQEILFKNDANEEKGLEMYEEKKAKYIEENGTDEGFVPYSVWFSRAVVNKGESFVYADGEWLDWSDVVEVMHTCGEETDSPTTLNADLTDFDNFSIHAYSEFGYFSTDHRIAEPQDKPYNVGDEVVCKVSLTKELDNETGVCEVFVNGKPIGSIDELAAGDSAELEYTYIVTENDLERGYFENTVQVFTMTADGSYLEFDLLDPLNNTTVRAEVSEPEKEPESKPDSISESESESEPDSESKSDETGSSESSSESKKEVSANTTANPKTGAAAGMTVIAAAAFIGMIISKKKAAPKQKF